MGTVTRLFVVDDVELDERRMQLLVREKGMRVAESIVSRAMEEIATRLTHLETLFAAGDFGEVEKAARALAAIAAETGLVSVSRSAYDLAGLGRAYDSATTAAVLSRLIRVGEMSLVMAWDTHDAQI